MRELSPSLQAVLDERERADLASYRTELKSARRELREIRADIRKIMDRARKRAQRVSNGQEHGSSV